MWRGQGTEYRRRYRCPWYYLKKEYSLSTATGYCIHVEDHGMSCTGCGGWSQSVCWPIMEEWAHRVNLRE